MRWIRLEIDVHVETRTIRDMRTSFEIAETRSDWDYPHPEGDMVTKVRWVPYEDPTA